MSKTDEFWQYAKEAILSASYAKTDDERQGLFDLARTWTQAALVERHVRVQRPRNVLPYLPRHAWQLGKVHSDLGCPVPSEHRLPS